MKKMNTQILFAAVLLGNIAIMQAMMSRSAYRLMRPGVRGFSHPTPTSLQKQEEEELQEQGQELQEEAPSEKSLGYEVQKSLGEDADGFTVFKYKIVRRLPQQMQENPADAYWARYNAKQKAKQEAKQSFNQSWMGKLFNYIFGEEQSQESQEESERDKQNRD